ncbi:MAG: acyl-CoA dehydrogenase family protein, partial [Brachybacterium sp.]|nr:acyl-CoA dehydrogenase family protein [Brachybacterium sp.]
MTDSSSQSRPVTTADGADLRPGALLPDDLLSALRERAEGHDRENTFPEQDLEDLRRIGYLRLLVPQDMGGLGATVLETTRLQRRLAGAAPATALAVNMHLVVTGAALYAHR